MGPSFPRGQTDACENITLPQTSFAGGKKGKNAREPLMPIEWLRHISNISVALVGFYANYHINVAVERRQRFKYSSGTSRIMTHVG